jgi:hypothetical protein
MEAEKKREKIHGWLLFALILLFLGACYNTWGGIHNIFNTVPPVTCMDIYIDTIGIIISMYEFYMFYCFFAFKSNAVFLGKALFYIVVIGNIISSTVIPTTFHLSGTIILFCFTIFQAIWIFFLYGSEQVKRLYPKEKRHASGWDYFIVGATFGLPIVFLIIALV